MQTVASKVIVVDGPEDEVKEYIAATIILHDFGLAVKNDAGLSLYTWDRVKQVSWSDPQVINQVWGLMLAQLAGDLEFDEEYMWEDDDDESPYGDAPEEPDSAVETEETTTDSPPKEETEKVEEAKEKDKDESDSDPYA
jgi:hypothetical protein